MTHEWFIQVLLGACGFVIFSMAFGWAKHVNRKIGVVEDKLDKHGRQLARIEAKIDANGKH